MKGKAKLCACGCRQPFLPSAASLRKRFKYGHRAHFLKSKNQQRPCACGCGQRINSFSRLGESRRFISGHNQRGVKKPLEWRRMMSRLLRKDHGPNPFVPCRCGCGKKIRHHDTRGRRRQFLPGHQANGRVWSHSHRIAMAQMMSGSKNHNWNPNRAEVGRLGQGFAKTQRRRLLGEHCKKCGSGRNLVLDHILPIMAGGTNADRNAQTLCSGCNQAKRKEEIREYGILEPLPQKIPHPNWMGNSPAGHDGFIPWGTSLEGKLFRRPGTRLLAVEIACSLCRKRFRIAAWRRRGYKSRPRPRNLFCGDLCRLGFLNSKKKGVAN